jgi:hypothetical protein
LAEKEPTSSEQKSFLDTFDRRKMKIAARLGAVAAAALLSYSVLEQEKTPVTVPASAEQVETEVIGDVVHNVPAEDEGLIDCGGVHYGVPFIEHSIGLIPFGYKTPNREVSLLENGDVQVNCKKAFGSPEIRE